jgi:alpha-D-ribose 1-methylphosphonate 5-triphosphate synthase subunit PhnH
MIQPVPLSPGFADPVHDAQHAFRHVLEALSRPGQRVTLGRPLAALALGPALAHLLLSLTDDDTPVWWQHADAPTAQWLRFHTGAPVTARPQEAAFAVVTSAADLPALQTFGTGSAAAPEFSSTLLIELPSLDAGPAVAWRGPGIRDSCTVHLAGLPQTFWAQWQANQDVFPQGVDIVFTCGNTALGLPRTTRAQQLQEA